MWKAVPILGILSEKKGDHKIVPIGQFQGLKGGKLELSENGI